MKIQPIFQGIICAMLKQLRKYPTCLPLLAISITLILTACGADTPIAPEPTPATATEIESPSPTAKPTNVPAAATVNGEIIPLAEFDAELARYQEAQTTLDNTVADETARETVLNDLIDQTLLAQGAHEAGYMLTDAELDARIADLAADIGGEAALSTWQTSHGYTSDSFRSSLKHAAEAAWMRDSILANLSGTAEQVHAQQILLYNRETAEDVQAQLETGADFGNLASAYDPKTNGDLGWFPRGYLLEPAIEEAAFSLNVGDVSEIIETEVGFHIIMVLDKEADRPLTPDALLSLQEKALLDWLQAQREASTIE